MIFRELNYFKRPALLLTHTVLYSCAHLKGFERRRADPCCGFEPKQIAECFNSYFANIVDTLNFPPDVIANDYEPIDDQVLNVINKYANHPSILRIQERFTSWETFEFSKVDHTIVYSEIMHLDKIKKKQVVMFR